jgi:MFS family permease
MKKFNEKYLYLYKFIGQGLPIYSFYQLLFIEKGLNISQIAILIVIWNVTAMVAEIPTGIIADKFSRRNLLVLSALIQGSGFLIWFFASSFWFFALGFVFWGIAGAMVSGTESSLIHDNLKFDGEEDKFTEVFGKAEFWGYMGVIVAILSAGVLINFVTSAQIALISAIICLGNAGLAMGIREKNYASENKSEEKSEGSVKEAVSFFKTNTMALLLLIFLVFFASFGLYLDEFDAFIAIDFERGPVWISVILVVRFAFMAIGDLLAPWFEGKMKSVKMLIGLTLVGNLILGVFSLIWNLFALVLFGLAFMFLAIATVLATKQIHESIKEEGRATIMSFVGLSQSLIMILVSLVFGSLAGILSVQQVYLVFTVFGILGCLIMVPLFKKVESCKAGRTLGKRQKVVQSR